MGEGETLHSSCLALLVNLQKREGVFRTNHGTMQWLEERYDAVPPPETNMLLPYSTIIRSMSTPLAPSRHL